MCSIPDGTYEIKIGETFLRGDKNNKSSKAEFNTLRCKLIFNLIEIA